MSFSTTIKEEILRCEYSISEKLSLVSALIKINGTLSFNNRNYVVDIRTESAKTAKFLFLTIKENYHIECRLLVSKKNQFNKNNIYLIQIRNNALEILEDLQLYTNGNFDVNPTGKLLKGDKEKRAYIAGCFLASGSINSPSSKNYHLEMSFNSIQHANYMEKLLTKYHLSPKVIQRRTKYVVYIKKSEEISDFLKLINCQNGVFEFEEERINKDYWNSNNRLNICEISNEVKTLNSAREQIDCINKIKSHNKEYLLDIKDKRIMDLRLSNPEANLQELADIYSNLYDSPIGKSGINHRMRKIKQIASEIKD